jgi:hypothetical protein
MVTGTRQGVEPLAGVVTDCYIVYPSVSEVVAADY